MTNAIALKVTRSGPNGAPEVEMIDRAAGTGHTTIPWVAPPRSRLESDVFAIEIGRQIMYQYSRPHPLPVVSVEIVRVNE